MDGVSGELVLVATPIGNLKDLSARAAEALSAADLVCCEDTRRTRALLSAIGVRAGRRLVAVHGHNEKARAAWVADHVEAGEVVAYVSDAGMPGVSDPGEALVAEAARRGLTVTIVPGPSAALAALVVSGLPTTRFCVEGFLPRRGAARARRLAALATEERTVVIFEAPSRVAGTVAELLAVLGDRRCAMCRELTKLHEEVVRGSLATLSERLANGDDVLGEVVLVVGGADRAPEVDDASIDAAVDEELKSGATVRDAADAVAKRLGVPHRRAYSAALERGHGTNNLP